LDNPEPEGLEEEPYIHDEYIADFSLNYQQGMSTIYEILASSMYCSAKPFV
jgi:hypothetical protein